MALFLAFVPARSAQSQTLVVGTCKPSSHPYTTIQSAVNAAAPGATVQVCPGTYAEQVVIATPLTLKGISAPPLANPTVVPPSGGLVVGNVQPVASPDAVASMIAVNTHGVSGAVNITGLALDDQNACPSAGFVAGILYLSTSGTVSGTAVENLGDNSCDGAAVWVENDGHLPMIVSAKNNLVQSFNRGYGIGAFTGPSASSLSLIAQDNVITQVLYGEVLSTNGGGMAVSNIIDGVGYGIYVSDASTVSNNVITAPAGALGVYVDGSGANVTGNTINDKGMAGIYVSPSSKVSITSNKIIGGLEELYQDPESGPGIVTLSAGATIKGNTIAHMSTGIEMDCTTAAVGSNNIFDATTGVSNVPPPMIISGNFVQVTTPQTACQ